MWLLDWCSSRIPRPIDVPASPIDESVLAIPRDTKEEHILAKYKHHYEQFRHVDDRYSNPGAVVSVLLCGVGIHGLQLIIGLQWSR